MKYSNGKGSRLVRMDTWFVVSPPPLGRFKEAHEWCKQNGSLEGFYHHYTNTRWWFESEDDALLFKLKFC